MRDKICGIILKVTYPAMGDTSTIEILGKSMLDWVKLSLGEGFVAAVDFSDALPLPQILMPFLNEAEFTVVLFSDTPLITRKTVLDAATELSQSKESVLKMTRGFVFRTDYLKNTAVIAGGEHRFFDEEDFMTAFSFKQACMIGDVLKNRILSYHMSQGVQIVDPASTHIGCDVVLGRGCVIHPDNSVKGRTVIKDGVTLFSGNVIENSVIESDCQLQKSVVSQSYVGARTKIGPFAHLRPNTKLGTDCRVGNFVEIKNSTLGAGCKAAHLSYIGDADLGEGCNIGCGTVFCNYDGKNKHRTVLGTKVFVGSNSNLIAPLNIGDNAFIAAGSTISQDVPQDNLAIARARQVNKDRSEKLPKSE